MYCRCCTWSLIFLSEITAEVILGLFCVEEEENIKNSPLINGALKLLFKTILYTRMTGYIPLEVSPDCYILMFILGICSYILVAFVQMAKINKIPMSNALKCVE